MLCLSYSLLRILNYTNKLLLENELYVLLSTQILKELISLPSTESNTFINVIYYKEKPLIIQFILKFIIFLFIFL